ncbi:SpoVR family protein, partial [Shewanella sp. 11B5]
ISAIHDDQGYQDIRNTLSQQYNLSNIEPNIQVQQVQVNGDRSIILRYIPFDNIPLADNHQEVLKHLHRLWGFNVTLEQFDHLGIVSTLSMCPETTPQSLSSLHSML